MWCKLNLVKLLAHEAQNLIVRGKLTSDDWAGIEVDVGPRILDYYVHFLPVIRGPRLPTLLFEGAQMFTAGTERVFSGHFVVWVENTWRLQTGPVTETRTTLATCLTLKRCLEALFIGETAS